ncbi:hypothetical protein SH501x_002283 [Pirellulaceae bacterium SH501]
MSSIFLPLIFLPIRLLIPVVAIEGRKMGGRKMKSKSSHQFFWDATRNNIVTYCMPGITNVVAEGIDRKIMSIQRRTGGCPHDWARQQSASADGISEEDGSFKAEWGSAVGVEYFSMVVSKDGCREQVQFVRADAKNLRVVMQRDHLP